MHRLNSCNEFIDPWIKDLVSLNFAHQIAVASTTIRVSEETLDAHSVWRVFMILKSHREIPINILSRHTSINNSFKGWKFYPIIFAPLILIKFLKYLHIQTRFNRKQQTSRKYESTKFKIPWIFIKLKSQIAIFKECHSSFSSKSIFAFTNHGNAFNYTIVVYILFRVSFNKH